MLQSGDSVPELVKIAWHALGDADAVNLSEPQLWGLRPDGGELNRRHRTGTAGHLKMSLCRR